MGIFLVLFIKLTVYVLELVPRLYYLGPQIGFVWILVDGSPILHLNAMFTFKKYLKTVTKLLATYYGFFRLGEILPSKNKISYKVVQLGHISYTHEALIVSLHNNKTHRS